MIINCENTFIMFNLRAFLVGISLVSKACFGSEKLVTRHDISSLLTLKQISKENQTFPAIASFKKDEFELRYIPACHTFNKENNLFKLIRDQIETFNPTFLILEGFQNENIYSIAESEKQPKEGESIFALRIASKKGIHVISGEPRDADLMAEMHQKFGGKLKQSEDVFTFYILRMLQQELRKDSIAENQDPRIAVNHIANLQAGFLDHTYSYDQLATHLLNKYEISNLSLPLIKEGQGDNFLCAYGLLLLELERVLEYDVFIRDQSILRTIFGCHDRDKSGKVLIIYGSSHYQTQLPVLESYFGKPKLFL